MLYVTDLRMGMLDYVAFTGHGFGWGQDL